MKYLSNYTEQAQTDLFNKYGVFFAFGGDQFRKALAKCKADGHLKEGEKVTDFGIGMFAPSKYAKDVQKGLSEIHKNGREQDLKENGKEKIIIRELYNYECFYTGDYYEAFNNSLQSYGITIEEVRQAYYKELPNSDL